MHVGASSDTRPASDSKTHWLASMLAGMSSSAAFCAAISLTDAACEDWLPQMSTTASAPATTRASGLQPCCRRRSESLHPTLIFKSIAPLSVGRLRLAVSMCKASDRDAATSVLLQGPPVSTLTSWRSKDSVPSAVRSSLPCFSGPGLLVPDGRWLDATRSPALLEASGI